MSIRLSLWFIAIWFCSGAHLISVYAGTPFPVDEVLTKESMRPRGDWEEVTWPDTLDLVDRANFSINVLTHNSDISRHCLTRGLSWIDGKTSESFGSWDITPKNARTLPTLRQMTGSDYNLDVDYALMHALLTGVREDGLLYYPEDCNKKGGTSYPQSNALLIFAMLNYHSLDNNPKWLEWVDTMAKALQKLPIHIENRSFIPMQCGIDPKGDWWLPDHDSVPPYDVPTPRPYDPLEEPKGDALGYEGAARAEANRFLSVMLRHYQLTGNTRSLDEAKRMIRFVLRPSIWDKNADEKRYPGYEHGIWGGHSHNGTQGLNNLLDMAVITNNDWLKQFCREYYANIARNGITRIGWFPCWTDPENHNHRTENLAEITEPCAIGDWVVDAVRMSDAGLGDYWDDADYVVRNHLIEQQAIDYNRLLQMAKIQPGTKDAETMQGYVGGFINGELTRFNSNNFPPCCCVNGAQGIYYAWHGITRFSKNVATVNLFLNRVSPWMDVASYLPYEGKVELRNKEAKTALVRIPGWVDKSKLEVEVRHESAPGEQRKIDNEDYHGNYLLFENLVKGDMIVIKFPNPVTQDQYTINGKQYNITFKGSTVLDITPRISDVYQFYQRDDYKQDKAPVRTVKRFVAHEVVPLGSF